MALPADAPIVDNDHDLAVLIDDGSATGRPVVVGVTGGDLHRTLGSPTHSIDQLRGGDAMGFPIDVGVLEVNGERLMFAAHMVATSSPKGTLWRGRTVIAMNAAFRGPQNLAPRGHPNDGRLDVIDGALGLIDRRRAIERALSGSHVPHPDLKVRHIEERGFESDSPLTIELDGTTVTTARSFTVRCLVDVATIIV